ncbi:DEAD/DEAH box helicase [Paenibacillus sp. DMB20]|uniref:DEAD/DEAH box helicase n=1 Tax=Paenibacillus sp. DMB20 TaxID=1642570 RepID=UPI000627C563|nr:DEAD/DEAH box helicase [Paenibacillus sp. DMB20]KKO51802.1 helicase SNF [Paenibacillus sp. DMB20]
MNLPLNESVIENLSGRTSFNKGASYVKAGRVEITDYEPSGPVFRAVVDADERYDISVTFRENGEIETECPCSLLLTFDKLCKHSAAVLLYLHRHQEDLTSTLRTAPPQEPGTTGEIKAEAGFGLHITNSLMELFRDQPQQITRSGSYFETRTVLEAEILCRVFSYGTKQALAVEMKIGPKRTFIVKNIRRFLEAVHLRESYPISNQFTYDPELHCFRKEDDDLIRRLHEVSAGGQAAYGTPPYRGRSGKLLDERQMLIESSDWEKLNPLLKIASSPLLEREDGSYDRLAYGEGVLPLHFEFEVDAKGTEGYRLRIQGLENITVLERYRLVLADGKLWNPTREQCDRLQALIRLLAPSDTNIIDIVPGQIETFMETVIPGLKQLGSVAVSREVSLRMVQAPLSARLYLDRVKDRLVAGLEFHYGDIVINPLEETEVQRNRNTILIRSGEQENRILDILDQSRFSRTEAGFFMDNEEDEFDFLYHTVPRLEQLLKIYATSAVKTRLFKDCAPPQVSIGLDERTEWLEFKLDIDGIPESEIRKVLQALSEKRRYFRMPTGALMPLEDAEYKEIIELANRMAINLTDLEGGGIRLPAFYGLRLANRDLESRAIRLEKPLRMLMEHLRNPDHLDFPVPSALASVLRDYQVYGYQWMKTLARYGFGGILADDMGLGKTLQSIAFLLSAVSDIRTSKLPALVVAPSSLMYNWLSEFGKFAPELKVIIADGTKQERRSALARNSGTDVVITSYPLLRMDSAIYAGRSFHTVIYDEAQFFKNDTTQTARAVRAVRAKHRFALTGTPVENRMEELWSIYGAVFPGLFPEKKEFSALPKETVARRIRPFLLRRLKTDVLKELPDKIETIQSSDLLPEQKKLYAAYLAKLRHESLKHLDEQGFQKSRLKILAGLTRLRQLCCHPALFVEGYEGESAKLRQLLEIVEECRNSGRRVLIFSQFTEMLGLIGRELSQNSNPYFYLDGSTPAAERLSICTRFNEGERDLFLISLKAGGTGLNLTGADTVILYDLWWNPAVEEQAADRAHRIGQKKTVQVIRLVARGTVEDKMYELQQKKKNLIDEVIHSSEGETATLSEQEIREILMI